MTTPHPVATATEEPSRGSTPRTRELISALRARGLSDRSGEWFRPDMFPKDIADPAVPVIVRYANANRAMLRAMVAPENSRTTRTYEIQPGELIVGVIPMGSVGLGKVLPDHLTEEERRVAFFSSRDVESTFGHNCPDHERVLRGGLRAILDTCERRIAELSFERSYPLGPCQGLDKKLSFYQAVRTSCDAVVDHAAAFADLAERTAATTSDADQRAELREIARVCRKVPLEPAETLHEALQSVYFIHLALHAMGNFNSIGRLDQLIEPHLRRSLESGEIDRARAVELIECFLIKCAGRLNMTSAHLTRQDHLDFATGLGTNPVFLDQVASANNFLQNIVVGGLKRDGADATVEATYLILEACANAGLPTPTVNIRLHGGSPAALVEAAARALGRGGNGLPIVYNDDSIVPALAASKIALEDARDYVVDGCWEPILNGKCDWTFGMVNMLTVLECALNAGALLTNNPSTLRGSKRSFGTPAPERLIGFDDLRAAFTRHLGHFVDQVALGLYNFYAIDASVTPTPLLSALLGRCLDKGIDKTWGGADVNLGGIIATALPNAANSLAAIRHWVYGERKYTLPEVVAALKVDFKGHEAMLADFKAAPKFGNADPHVDDLVRWLLDELHAAVVRAETFADFVFLAEPSCPAERERVASLRALCGYDGPSMKARFGQHFDIQFTAGAGTFGQYAFMGGGVNASAEGRHCNAPLTPNCSPVPGTVKGGIGHLLSSAAGLGLNRFGAGLVFDVCLEAAPDNHGFIEKVLRGFVANGGNIMTVSIANHRLLKTIATLCDDVRNHQRPPEALDEYSGLSVRVGGWNAPFVTFTQAQQASYVARVLDSY